MARGTGQEGGLERKFEGRAQLDELLEVAGSPYDSEGVLVAFRAARADGAQARDVIPSLFEGEPRFAHPEVARRLYGNLLGLWDLVAQGGPVSLEAPPAPEARPRPQRTPAPPPYGEEGPDEAFVEQAWRHLEDDERSRTRLVHAFENRQHHLLEVLDGVGLSDEGYAVAHLLLFELHAFLELGRPGGPPAVDGRVLEREVPRGTQPPPALVAYAEEALFEATQDEESPLAAEELPRVRELVERGLAALWDAQQQRKGA